MVVNASNVQAYKYEPFFAKLASWGFIVVGNDDGQTGTGESSAFTLDYVLNVGENNILYKFHWLFYCIPAQRMRWIHRDYSDSTYNS